MRGFVEFSEEADYYGGDSSPEGFADFVRDGGRTQAGSGQGGNVGPSAASSHTPAGGDQDPATHQARPAGHGASRDSTTAKQSTAHETSSPSGTSLTPQSGPGATTALGPTVSRDEQAERLRHVRWMERWNAASPVQPDRARRTAIEWMVDVVDEDPVWVLVPMALVLVAAMSYLLLRVLPLVEGR